MYAKTAIRDSVWHWVIQSSLTGKKDKEGHYGFVYSDLGLIMMQHLVEKVSGQPLDIFVKNTFYQPLGLATTGYNPLQRFPKVQMAPTENDKVFREITTRNGTRPNRCHVRRCIWTCGFV
jgi:CubicO group peptidase (beta-lactamase class C family)